jgi:hypothetical protein
VTFCCASMTEVPTSSTIAAPPMAAANPAPRRLLSMKLSLIASNRHPPIYLIGYN